MLTDIRQALRPALVLLGLMTLLLGLLYPLAITGVAQLVFPYQANGSLIRDGNGVRGSELIGQTFAAPRYFRGRASAAGTGYDASASSGSNLGPTSADLKKAVGERVAMLRADGVAGPIPADAATASGSGLDPQISPANAFEQVRRVATARGIPEATIADLVNKSVDRSVVGEPTVNVLLLNRQLDASAARSAR
ncbi:MAG: potassium-transporting ATPase subunit KdpC [Sphingomicrobium sp.]